MSRVFFAGDLHLGHRNIIKYRPNFQTTEEHDFTVLDNIKTTVNKRDILYLMGDIAFTHEALNLVKGINCSKIAILGNHDFMGSIKIHDLIPVYDKIFGLHVYKGFWLSHAPIHSDELRKKFGNIHGHTHDYCINDNRYINTSIDQFYYSAVEFKTIQEIASSRGLYERTV
jgi:calcineurin-like phosphoesterase family protein